MPREYQKKAVTTAKTAALAVHLFPEVTMEEAIPERHFESWQVTAERAFTHLANNGILVIKSPRQHGKSYWLQSAAVWCAVNHPETTTIVVSPVNSQNGRMYEDIKYMLYEDERVDKMLGLPDMQIVFRNGSKIIFKSAETGDRLRGFTAHYLFVDEAAYIDDTVFATILPYLTVTKGRMVLTSTPRFKAGRFYFFYEKGLQEGDLFQSIDVKEYDESFFITEQQKAQYKEMMPPSSYKTEIEGLFLDSSEGLFGNYAACVSATPSYGAPVWAGIDWAAKGKDQTVLTALTADGEVCEIKTWKAKDAVSQVGEIAAWINEHATTLRKVTVEENSIGAIYYDMLRQEVTAGSVLSCFYTSNSSKRQLIDNLAALLGRKAITLPNDPELLKQMSLFTATLTDNGNVTYAGANGSHDDYVMSLAFAAWNVRVNKAKYCISVL